MLAGGALMWEALGTVRDLGRLQEIASVLIRYGFGDVVRRIGMGDVLERAGRLLHWNNAEGRLRMSAALRVRRALEASGPPSSNSDRCWPRAWICCRRSGSKN